MEEAIQPVSPGFNLSLTIKVPFERLTGGIIKARPQWIVDTVRRVQSAGWSDFAEGRPPIRRVITASTIKKRVRNRPNVSVPNAANHGFMTLVSLTFWMRSQNRIWDGCIALQDVGSLLVSPPKVMAPFLYPDRFRGGQIKIDDGKARPQTGLQCRPQHSTVVGSDTSLTI
jgi:hypothetical protein